MWSIGDTTKIEMIFISKSIIEMYQEKKKSIKKTGKKISTIKTNTEKKFKEVDKEWMITNTIKMKNKRNIIEIWNKEQDKEVN